MLSLTRVGRESFITRSMRVSVSTGCKCRKCSFSSDFLFSFHCGKRETTETSERVMHSSPSKRDSAGKKSATHQECKSCVNRTQPATYWRVKFGLRIGWPGIDRTDASVCRCLFSNLEATCWPQSTAHTHTTPHHKTTIKPGFVSTSSSHQHASINNQQGKKTKDDSKNKRRICRHWDFESQFVLRIRVRNKCIKMTRCETVGRLVEIP